jgi:exopolyphosphatase/guanosine-5'-triphosphate,3'-diphosphate pyrophosphatase
MDTEAAAVGGWKAGIDLGSNTFQWAVGRWSPAGFPEIRARSKKGVGLGRGGMAKKTILEEARLRAHEVLASMKQDLADLGFSASEVRVIGTSAFRNAENAAEFVSEIELNHGFRVEVISGEEEARLIFNGVRASGAIPSDGESLILDIGGGSVEFIWCQRLEPIWKQSFEIGGLRMMERFHQQDPITPEKAAEARLWLEEQLQPLWELAESRKPPVLLGCSGAFDTLGDMQFRHQNQEKKAEDFPWGEIQPDFLKQKALPLRFLPLEQRLQIPGMIPLRAGMMPLALVLIQLLLDRLSCPAIRYSTWSLKEGLLFQNQP